MMINKTTFNIDITFEEAQTITKVLHKRYKERKKEYESKETNDEKLYEEMKKARELRNAFASLVNVSYMGEDF